MYCKNCGIEIDNDSIFCQNCGEKINNNPESYQSYKTEITTKDNNNTELSDTSEGNFLRYIITFLIIFVIVGEFLHSYTFEISENSFDKQLKTQIINEYKIKKHWKSFNRTYLTPYSYIDSKSLEPKFVYINKFLTTWNCPDSNEYSTIGKYRIRIESPSMVSGLGNSYPSEYSTLEEPIVCAYKNKKNNAKKATIIKIE